MIFSADRLWFGRNGGKLVMSGCLSVQAWKQSVVPPRGSGAVARLSRRAHVGRLDDLSMEYWLGTVMKILLPVLQTLHEVIPTSDLDLELE